MKDQAYTADMSLIEQSKTDKIRVKKFKSPNVEKKKFKLFIPEQRLWLYADDQKILDRMEFKLREPVIIMQ